MSKGVRCGDLHVKLSEFWEAEWPLAPQSSWRRHHMRMASSLFEWKGQLRFASLK